MEANKKHAQEKQVEVDILSRSVEELERTVFALESQVCDTLLIANCFELLLN